jgi:hypothetical protein
MTRPKNSKDKIKRKNIVKINKILENAILLDYENGVSTTDIMNRYNISKSTISVLRNKRNIQKRLDHKTVVQWERIGDFDEIRGVSGIYCIYFVWNYNNDDPEKHYKINNIKAYIGSSVNIKNRLQSHIRSLIDKKHYNKKLQQYYDDTEYTIKYAIIERCDETEVMTKEKEYLHTWHQSCLLNTWRATQEKDVVLWLEKAIKMDSYTKHFTLNYQKMYNNSPCKESNCIHKSGYGKMAIVVNQKTKYVNKHRVAYWERYGEYPELVRHMCGNKHCYNADHLAKGNHQDNALDKRGVFPETFIKKWIEFDGNIEKLSKFFKWKYPIANSPVYYWEKELNLRNKYPDIIKNRSKRNIYNQDIKKYISQLLKTHNKEQIKKACLDKFGILVGDKLIYSIGSPKTMLKNKENNPVYQFIKKNINRYVDSELCDLINQQFDAGLSVDRLTTMRFNWGLYRGKIKPNKTLKRKDEDSIYGIEFKEFLKQNYLKYSDKELGDLCVLYKITNGYAPWNQQSWEDFIKERRVKYYGLLRDNEEEEPWFVDADGTRYFYNSFNREV